MIQSKKDLKEYMDADAFAMSRKGTVPMFYDYAWRYIRCLRKSEYYLNCRKDVLGRALGLWHRFCLHQLGVKCGYEIPLNACGKGLSLAHIGSVIINGGAKLGEYCRIHAGVNIGTAAGESSAAPQIGSRVYIGPGAKLFGPIVIADDIAVGANAVVNKSFTDKGCSIGGIPAKVIGEKGSKGLLLSKE